MRYCMPSRLKSGFGLVLLACVVAVLAQRPAAGLDAADKLEQYARQTWQTENGLPQNTVSAILQTSDGYLWFATDGGLARFDGQHFAIFDTQTGALRSDRVRGLAQDR